MSSLISQNVLRENISNKSIRRSETICLADLLVRFPSITGQKTPDNAAQEVSIYQKFLTKIEQQNLQEKVVLFNTQSRECWYQKRQMEIC